MKNYRAYSQQNPSLTKILQISGKRAQRPSPRATQPCPRSEATLPDIQGECSYYNTPFGHYFGIIYPFESIWRPSLGCLATVRNYVQPSPCLRPCSCKILDLGQPRMHRRVIIVIPVCSQFSSN